MVRLQSILWALFVLTVLFVSIFNASPLVLSLTVLALSGMQLLYITWRMAGMKKSVVRSLIAAFVVTEILFCIDKDTHSITDLLKPGNIAAAVLYTAGIFCLFSSVALLAYIVGKKTAVKAVNL